MLLIKREKSEMMSFGSGFHHNRNHPRLMPQHQLGRDLQKEYLIPKKLLRSDRTLNVKTGNPLNHALSSGCRLVNVVLVGKSIHRNVKYA